MRENYDRISNSFKTGVIVWILAYLLLYFTSAYVGDFSVYNENVMKLLDVRNFIAQLLIAGTTYIIFEIVLLQFVDNMLKILETGKDKGKSIAKNLIGEIIVVTTTTIIIGPNIETITCISLYVLKENGVITKYVLKLMMTVIGAKAVIFEITQVVKTNKFNKKLKEKNK